MHRRVSIFGSEQRKRNEYIHFRTMYKTKTVIYFKEEQPEYNHRIRILWGYFKPRPIDLWGKVMYLKRFVFFFFAIKLFIYSQDAAAFRGCTNGCHADLFKRIGYQLNVAHLFQTQFRLLRVHTHQRLPLILRWYRLVTGFFSILQAKERLADRETKQGPLTTHTVYNCIQWLAKL